jgi:hypothetical protein
MGVSIRTSGQDATRGFLARAVESRESRAMLDELPARRLYVGVGAAIAR